MSRHDLLIGKLKTRHIFIHIFARLKKEPYWFDDKTSRNSADWDTSDLVRIRLCLIILSASDRIRYIFQVHAGLIIKGQVNTIVRWYIVFSSSFSVDVYYTYQMFSQSNTVRKCSDTVIVG